MDLQITDINLIAPRRAIARTAKFAFAVEAQPTESAGSIADKITRQYAVPRQNGIIEIIPILILDRSRRRAVEPQPIAGTVDSRPAISFLVSRIIASPAVIAGITGARTA